MKVDLRGVDLYATHSYWPEQVMSSEELERQLAPLYDRLRLHPGRLELMTGIKERRITQAREMPSDMSAKAAAACLDRVGFARDQVDLIIHTSVCRDFLEPATAARVHHLLGLKSHCAFMDLSNACLGMLSALTLAAGAIQRGEARAVVLCSGENGTPLIRQTIKKLNEDQSLSRKQVKPYFSNLTIGSAGVAFLLTKTGANYESQAAGPCAHLEGSLTLTDSSAYELCQGHGDQEALYMETDSEALMNHGIELAKQAWEGFKQEFGWTREKAQHLITHQVGERHQQALVKALNLDSSTLEKWSTFPFLGNTGSAALPTTLDWGITRAAQMNLQKDHNLALMGIGSGLVSSIVGMRWAWQVHEPLPPKNQVQGEHL